ncbi:MAG: FtsX-like permease family protein [Anaerolineaceae bacterium]
MRTNPKPLLKVIQLTGLLLVSLSLTLFLNLSRFSNESVTQDLQDSWRTSYDILVRPKNADAFLDVSGQRLIEPNFLSGQPGGITRAQYETIQAIEGVEVAAPIAMIGYLPMGFLTFSDTISGDPEAPWVVYKDVKSVSVTDNVRTYEGSQITYTIQDRVESIGGSQNGLVFVTESGESISVPNFMSVEANNGIQVRAMGKELLTDRNGEVHFTHGFNSQIDLYLLIAGIDPESENALVGLEDAITAGRYLEDQDQPNVGDFTWGIPVIANQNLYRKISVESNTFRVMLPEDEHLAAKLHENGLNYLLALPEEALQLTDIPSITDFYSQSLLTFINVAGCIGSSGEQSDVLALPSPVNYRQLDSFQGYDLVLEAQPVGLSTISAFKEVQLSQPEVSYRIPNTVPLRIRAPERGHYELCFLPVGAFNLGDLPSSSLSEVPMETYSLPYAVLQYDLAGNAVNPTQIVPTNNYSGYLADTPALLMNLDTAEFVSRREDFISAIRVRVSGIEAIGEESQKRIEAVAEEIRAQTGLQVDITLGSSPQNVLVKVPGYEDVEGLGYLEEHWARQLVGISIQREVNKEHLLFLAALIISGSMYTLSSAYLNVTYQRKQIGLYKAMGWRSRDIINHINKFTWLFIAISLVFSALVSLTLIQVGRVSFSIYRVFGTIIGLIILYVVGTLLAARQFTRQEPINLINSQDQYEVVESKVKNSIRKNDFKSKLPSLLAMSSAVILFVFVMAVVFYVPETLQGSLLGESISMKVQPFHIALTAIALIIGGLCIFQMLMTRIIERGREIGLVKAIGWRDKQVFWSFLKEGLGTSLQSAIIGTTIAIAAFWLFYSRLPTNLVVLILLGIGLPCLLGLTSSIYPALRAAKNDPISLIQSSQ